MINEIYRKLIHLSSLIYPVLYSTFLSKKEMLLITGSILIFLIIIEFLRFANKDFVAFINKYFSIFSRKWELEGGIYGATYFMMGTFFSIFFFEKNIAITAITVLVVSDTFASLIGKLIASPKLIGEKSLSGFLAFFVSSFFISIFLYKESLLILLLISFITAIVELVSKKIQIDDNLSIPITFGLLCNIFN